MSFIFTLRRQIGLNIWKTLCLVAQVCLRIKYRRLPSHKGMRIPKRRKFLPVRKRLDGGQTCAKPYDLHVSKREESDDQTKSCETQLGRIPRPHRERSQWTTVSQIRHTRDRRATHRENIIIPIFDDLLILRADDVYERQKRKINKRLRIGQLCC